MIQVALQILAFADRMKLLNVSSLRPALNYISYKKSDHVANETQSSKY
jgi:hypothetical protein